MSRPSHRRAALLIVVPALAALVLGCFEQPITEGVEVRFLSAEAVMVRVLMGIADPDRFRDSAPARARIEEERRRIEEGRDQWTSRIAGMDPLAERIVLDRREGRVVR